MNPWSRQGDRLKLGQGRASGQVLGAALFSGRVRGLPRRLYRYRGSGPHPHGGGDGGRRKPLAGGSA